MKEEGRRIRKTTEAFRADYKTTTTIQVMSDSEAKPSLQAKGRKPDEGLCYSQKVR